ncbi:unnamed protein product [Urochloa humidicola]
MEHIQEGDRSKWMAHSNHTIKCFTKCDIDRMTNSYRASLGSGAFGEVYEGVLEDGSKVAVKMFIHNVKENFAKELIVHREINHKNVLRLIGCCEEENALTLVTEYIANGNLSDFLHNDNCRPIPLDVRLRIAIECAEALAYMHSHMYTQVIHGDIKPGNILLDSNFHAKLSDFGISRLANTDKTLHTKNVIGSIGYMDPLFASDGRLTVKYDVYSFGVVLLELITRKKPTAVIDSVNIVYAFTNALASGIRGARGMFDAEIASKNNMKILERVAKLAGECLMMERGKRPDMIDVLERLRVLRKALHQDQEQQRVDLFSWVRKSKPAPSAALTIPTNISPSDLCRQFSLKIIKAATNNFHESRVIGQGGVPVTSNAYGIEEVSPRDPSLRKGDGDHLAVLLTHSSPYASFGYKHSSKGQVIHWVSKLSRRAQGFMEHVTLGPKLSEIVKGKLSLGARILQARGVKRMFRQAFSADKGERLVKALQCYLYTTGGPIAGMLFISTKNAAFRSDQPITVTSPKGDTARVTYKAVIPLRRISKVRPSENADRPEEKYIHVTTVDGFEFWFMGFVSYQQSWRYMEQAVSEVGVVKALII